MHDHDARLALIHEWLTRDLGLRPERIEPASSDASFRRYFRAFDGAQDVRRDGCAPRQGGCPART